MMDEMFIWIFMGLGVILIFTMVYDLCFKCKHEWEREEVRVNDKKRGRIDGTLLICKKCGKVKVIK